MKEFDSINKIKKESLRRVVLGIIYELILGSIIIFAICGLIYLFIKFGKDKAYWAVLIIALPLLLAFILFFLITLERIKEAIKDYKNPSNNSRFLRYGPPDKINEIINELNNNPIYSDSKIIINNKFIYIKKELNSLCALEDIIAVYKVKYILISKYHKKEVRLYYVDKFGRTYSIGYSYLFDNVKCVDKIIKYLIPRCKKAKFGYKRETFDYIDNYKKEEEPEHYNNREIKEIKVKKELINEDKEIEESSYDEDLENLYSDKE